MKTTGQVGDHMVNPDRLAENPRKFENEDDRLNCENMYIDPV